MTELQRLVDRYEPVVSSVEFNSYGYWDVTWSVAPGYRAVITCAKLGSTRQGAIDLTRIALSNITRKG